MSDRGAMEKRVCLARSGSAGIGRCLAWTRQGDALRWSVESECHHDTAGA